MENETRKSLPWLWDYKRDLYLRGMYFPNIEPTAMSQAFKI